MPTYRAVADAIKEQWVLPGKPGERLPTERTFETHFQVSRATISRALSILSAEGIIRVRRGSGAYIAPKSASSSGSRLLGFIAPRDPGKGELQNPVLHRLYAGVERRAVELGYQVLAASTNDSITHEAYLIDQFVQFGVQGLVLYPTYFPEPRHGNPSDPLAQRWKNTPIVLTDIGFNGWNRSMVTIDNFRLGHDLTWGLVQQGRKRVAFLHTTSRPHHTGIQERQAGWSAALRRANLAEPAPLQHAYEALTAVDADALIGQLLEESPPPDALIAWDDPTAITLIQCLQNRGLRVPDDILVAGFDNYEAGRFFQPAFPTTQPDFARMGELAIELLDEQIRHPATRPRTLLMTASVLWRSPKGGERKPLQPTVNVVSDSLLNPI